MTRAASDPEWRLKQSENKKALWADPVWVVKWKSSRDKTKNPQLAKHRGWNTRMRKYGLSFEVRLNAITAHCKSNDILPN